METLRQQPPEANGREQDIVPVVSLVEIFFKAKQLEKQGRDVIHFDAGEPDFEPPELVVEETVRAIRSGRGRYTEPSGIPEVRKAISDHVNRRYHLSITPKETLMTVGGRMALYYAFLTLPRNSKVGVISPDWPAYRDLVKFMNFEVEFFPTKLENGWTLDLDAIRESSCNALILNNPNNPTGKIIDPATLDRLVDIAAEKDMTIIGDEVYSDYIHEGAGFKSLLQTKECKRIFTTSFSKSYSMTGYRAGYVVADERTISKLEQVNSLILTSPPEFVQYGAIAALQSDAYVKEKAQMIRKRRDVATSALKKHLDAEFYVPDGSLYIFPKLHSKTSPGTPFDSEQFALRLLQNAFVSVTPGTSFGSWYKEHIRMTLLQSEQRIEEGIERMAKQLQ